jgi:hypothetical protein
LPAIVAPQAFSTSEEQTTKPIDQIQKFRT